MRKLFRFKYEPCNGTCYCYEEIFYEELRGQPHVSSLIDLVVQAHDNLCDNPDYSFGIDKCEFRNFKLASVAHVRWGAFDVLHH